MKKFDRILLIFIGLGIWALAASQVFKPSSVVAVGSDCGFYVSPCNVYVTNFPISF